jgi:outer membrane beta-barrel protein
MRFFQRLLFGLLALAEAAAAQTQDELVEKVAVRNRLFTVEKRFELGANFGVSLLPKLTAHYTINASGAYNVTEWLGIELRAGYAISNQTSLADQIRVNFASNGTISKVSDAADLWEMTGHAVAGVRFQPIYGKINLISELPVHFQLYGWVGGGAALLKRESMVFCTAKSGSACDAFLQENKASPLVSLALGFRFFLFREAKHSLKLEVRSWSFLDSYVIDVTRALATPANPTSGGRTSPDAGLTTLVQIDIGYAFIF